MNASVHETIFSVCGVLAMLGWVGIAALPRSSLVVTVLARLLIPALIAVVYVVLMLTHQAPEDGGFGSLAAVSALFSVDGLLLAGWIHYLAFDLFVGTWEVEDAQRRGVPHLLVLPCLLLTFLAGPAGLAAYLLVRGGTRLVRGAPDAAAAAPEASP